jgi:membrane protein DedA with SNARE-associated domain
MRVLASLLAGALHMPWRKFVLFNFLGAAVWVTAICGAGYLFGGHWGRLIHDLKRFDLVVAIVVVVAALLWWWRSRNNRDSR